ncbi:MAG: hypothetical protein QXD60_02325 [Nanopusillaceae archaeon]
MFVNWLAGLLIGTARLQIIEEAPQVKDERLQIIEEAPQVKDEIFRGTRRGLSRQEAGRIAREFREVLEQVKLVQIVLAERPGCQGEPVIVVTQPGPMNILERRIMKLDYSSIGLSNRELWALDADNCTLYDVLQVYARGGLVKGYGFPNYRFISIWELPLYYYLGERGWATDAQGRLVRVFYSRLVSWEDLTDRDLERIPLGEFLRLIQREPVLIRNPDPAIRY